MRKSNYKKNKFKTPWGLAQSTVSIAPGIERISTASHGGYFLSREHNLTIPLLFRQSTCAELGLDGWYEEDCDWAIVVVFFKECFDNEKYLAALESLKQSHPELFELL